MFDALDIGEFRTKRRRLETLERRMAQSRRDSLLESATNILVGYTVALGSQIVIFRWLRIEVPIGHNLLIGGWLTVVSLIRTYLIRRFFNSKRE